MIKPLALTVALLAGTALVGCNNEPENYEDCILKYVKSGMSDPAVFLLRRTCREKFPLAPEEKAIDLAQYSFSLKGHTDSNRSAIREILTESTGWTEVTGWEAKELSKGMYLVLYTVRIDTQRSPCRTFKTGDISWKEFSWFKKAYSSMKCLDESSAGWVFEVNSEAGTVRNVLFNRVLEERYGFERATPRTINPFLEALSAGEATQVEGNGTGDP